MTNGSLIPVGFGRNIDELLASLEKGVIDSMSIVEMISFIGKEFGVFAQEEEISDATSARFQESRASLEKSGLISPADADAPLNGRAN